MKKKTKKRHCELCNKIIPKDAHKSRIYCSKICERKRNRVFYNFLNIGKKKRYCKFCGEELTFTKQIKYCKKCSTRILKVSTNARSLVRSRSISKEVKKRKKYLDGLSDKEFFDLITKPILKDVEDKHKTHKVIEK